MKKVLVLCTGNACRSQMAEGYLRFFAGTSVEVYSAGISPHRVHPKAIEVMMEDNIDISSATSKDVNQFSGEQFDALITVCGDAGKHSLGDIAASTVFHYDIPDPERFSSEDTEQVTKHFIEIREEVKKCMLRFVGKYVYTDFMPSSEAA